MTDKPKNFREHWIQGDWEMTDKPAKCPWCGGEDKHLAVCGRPFPEATDVKWNYTEPISDEELELLDEHTWQLDEKPSQVVDRLIAEVRELRSQLASYKENMDFYLGKLDEVEKENERLRSHPTDDDLIRGQLHKANQELRAENERLKSELQAPDPCTCIRDEDGEVVSECDGHAAERYRMALKEYAHTGHWVPEIVNGIIVAKEFTAFHPYGEFDKRDGWLIAKKALEE